MNMTIGAVVHGFEITRVRSVDELGARCVEMRHRKTGAELLWFNSGAENKLFSIAFKTIPEDSTGVFHILEHSVLCGSENYPVREPFVELLKGSLNTFLNAMTFPDKTMYPVSSRNERDFINLTRVYLDAVFRPAILTNPNIFYQEGWHYELESREEAPTFNGVVYNEMKGAYSSVDRVMDRELSALLFPDSCYGLSSGGDPVHIPELTYEQFIDTYRRFYHPSNSRIYLDGELPIDEVLEIIDSEYLSAFDGAIAPAELALQQPVNSVERVCSYEIGADESTENRAQMMMGKVICDWSDRERQLAAYALGDYLTDSNESPLQKAILDAGLGEDVTMSIDDGTAQPTVYLLVRNTSYDKREQLSELIASTAARLLEDGLDRQSLEAALNRVEFSLREGREPMGLERAINALGSWLYGGDPLLYLTQDEVFASLRARLDSDYFEQLLREFLIERLNTAVVWCLPSNTLGEERVKAEAQRAADASAGWSGEDIERVLALNETLKQWQQTPDSPENLEKLPVLALSEVDERPSERVIREQKVNGVTVLCHPTEAKGISYLTFYFDTADASQDELCALSLMSKLLGELPTVQHTAAELNREIKTHIGSLDFGVRQYSAIGQTDGCRLYFTARCSVLDEEIDNAVALVAEVLTQTRFDLPEVIAPHITQLLDRNRRAIIGQGHLYGLMRALSPYSAESFVNEKLTGYSLYDYLRSLNDAGTAGAESFGSFAAEFAGRTFCAERLTLSITSGTETDAARIISALPAGTACGKALFAPELPEKRGECIKIPAAVSFAALGINVYALDEEYTAAISLMSHIVSFNYLWNAIRVQGGAYGAGLMASNAGNLCFYTYRDPNSCRSLDIFRKTADFLREFCAQGDSLDKSIIGCISKMDPLASVKDISAAADSDWFRGIDYDYRCRVWNDLLHTDSEKLLALCGMIEQMASTGSVCVIGGADIVDACAEEKLTELRY